MTTSIRKVMAVVLAMALASFIISCASTGSLSKKASATPQTKGFLNGYYQYLKPGPEGGRRWFKPGVDFGKYHKIMLPRMKEEPDLRSGSPSGDPPRMPSSSGQRESNSLWIGQLIG
jgi:hypothetical protein